MPDRISPLIDRVVYAARAAKATAAEPYEGFERTLERVLEVRDRYRPSWRYDTVPDFEQRVHQLVGARWPCEERQQFHEVWGATLDDLAAGGLQVGRGTFAGWDDGDARLAGVTWCLARHLRPDRVVETGVARGVTTRVTLEALGRNGHGRLWSIDLPPLLERTLSDETGAAVPPRLHERWSLLRGSSRRLLPSLVADVGQIDLFLHDSMHTTRNLEFELSQVWPALSPGGAALIDDVDKNVATGRFLQAHPTTPAAVSWSDDGKALIACLIKPSEA